MANPLNPSILVTHFAGTGIDVHNTIPYLTCTCFIYNMMSVKTRTWTACWFAWQLILLRMWNVYNANQIVLIPLWMCVNASPCACSVCVSRMGLGVHSTMWGVSHRRGTFGGLYCVVSFPRFVMRAPPCRRGGLDSHFVLKWTHQMHLFTDYNI